MNAFLNAGTDAIPTGKVRRPEAANANFGRKPEKWSFAFPACEHHLVRTKILERYEKKQSRVEVNWIEMYLAGVPVRCVAGITGAL